MDLCKRCPYNPKVSRKVKEAESCSHVGNMWPEGELCRYAEEYVDQDEGGCQELLMDTYAGYIATRDSYDITASQEDYYEKESGVDQEEHEKKIKALFSKLNFDRLKPIQKKILKMYYYQHLTEREIADKLQCAPSNVNYHRQQISKKLRKDFE